MYSIGMESMRTNEKKSMTLTLTEGEMAVLEELCDKKQLTKTALIRQALRLYRLVDIRVEAGEKLFFEDEMNKKKAEVMVI